MKTTRELLQWQRIQWVMLGTNINIRYHFVREGVQDGAIILKYVATGEMMADILTKLLPKCIFEKLVIELGMKTVK